tara:strand:- start:4717 stop:5343 length:627 start_codon:yes stop_codon:yes gene_type:complete
MNFLSDFLFTKTVSFDVGVKHCSFAELQYENHTNTFSIKKWTIIQLRGKNISDYTNDMISKLREYDWGLVDYVLIEQQLNRNTQMKVLSHVIQSFFLCERRTRSERIKFVSPKLKFSTSNQVHNEIVQKCKDEMKLDPLNHGGSYTLKKLSIRIVNEILSKSPTESYWLKYFNSCKKNDDLADCLLQCLAWHMDVKTNGTPMEIDCDI